MCFIYCAVSDIRCGFRAIRYMSYLIQFKSFLGVPAQQPDSVELEAEAGTCRSGLDIIFLALQCAICRGECFYFRSQNCEM